MSPTPALECFFLGERRLDLSQALALHAGAQGSFHATSGEVLARAFEQSTGRIHRFTCETLVAHRRLSCFERAHERRALGLRQEALEVADLVESGADREHHPAQLDASLGDVAGREILARRVETLHHEAIDLVLSKTVGGFDLDPLLRA